MAWKKIVVGVDGSPESVRAAVTGAMLAEQAEIECVLVHAVPDYQTSFAAPGIAMDMSDVAAMAASYAREFITGTLQHDLRPAVLDGLRTEVGRAPVVLERAIKSLDAGLLVLGASIIAASIASAAAP